jgi:Protein of unknown function (DUF4232)
MRQRWPALAAGVVLAATAGGAPAASGRLASCRTDAFALEQLPANLGHPTGSNMLLLVVRNRAAACVLYGYPRLALLDARGPLPFVISHRGDQVVTSARPRRIRVRAGGSAVVLADKYRCDLGDRRKPRAVRLAFPGRRSGTALTLSLQARRQYDDLAYCGPGDPGSILAVSPFEPTPPAAQR